MAMFACRWATGDCAFIEAMDERDAWVRCDEAFQGVGLPEKIVVVPFGEFWLYCRLTDEGRLAIGGDEVRGPDSFGMGMREFVDTHLYPKIAAAEMEADGRGLDADTMKRMVRSAVRAERAIKEVH